MTLRSPATARHRPRRLAALWAVATVLLTLGAVPSGAVAATPDQPSQLTVVVSPSAHGVVTDGLPVTVTVAAVNPTQTTIPAGTVRLSTSTTPLTGRAELTAWLADPADAGRTETVLADTAMAAVTAGGTADVEVSVDATVLTGAGPGVYPLRAEYASAQGTFLSASTLVVPAGAGTGPLAVVVPLTAPPLTAGLLTEAELTALTADGGSLRDQLDAVTGTAAILAVDPAIVAAIRVLGSDAPAPATRWLNDLMSLPNPRFALQFGDADAAVQVAAGLSAPLTVTTLAPYLSADGFAGATPTPAATPSGTLPDLDQLMDIGTTVGTVVWPATGTAGVETVASLAATGALTLIDSGVLTTESAGAWATLSGAPVLVADQDVSRALSGAAGEDSAIGRDSALTTASAYAALTTAAAPDAPLLVTIDRAQIRTAAGLKAAIAAAVTLAGRTATDLSALTAGTPATVTVAAAPDSAEAAAGLGQLLTEEATLAQFATILADPTLLTGPERATILQLIGNGWRAVPSEAKDAVAAHHAQTASTLGSVTIAPPSDITLAATSAPLTFSVRNELRWPVFLVLHATPHDPRLVVQQATSVEVGPAQNARIQVPVQSRVGSGDTMLRLQLRSPSGVAVGEPVPVRIAVHAEWESVGIIVMAVIVGGMLVVGIVRTLRRRQRGKENADG